MIGYLRGTVQRLSVGEVIMDVSGVGYRVFVPLSAWELLEDGAGTELQVVTYIREDRFDLFGFLDRGTKNLFEALIRLSGIGPKIALELCSVPKSLLLRAVHEQDPGLLKNVKGVGRKTAEKLLVEFKALLEKNPDLLGTPDAASLPHEFDQDAVAALTALGYESSTIISALRSLPRELRSTEDRVAAALRVL